MVRTMGFFAVLAFAAWMVAGCLAADETIDLAKAKADPDFAIQGEYCGEGSLLADESAKVGAQVVALGEGKFDVYVLDGGLPGEGWKRGAKRIRIGAERDGDGARVSGEGFEGKIADGVLSLSKEKGKAALKRVERHSPTLGEKPPAGAKVLFGGPKQGADNWQNPHLSPAGFLMGDSATKEKFGDYRLHLEFLLSYMPKARGQGRSNSGVYIHDCYECQVLDSFGLTGENNECGGFYTIKTPDVNMCLPPLAWQTYDIEYRGPRYDADGKKTANTRVTVKHNGVTIHDNFELPKGCPGRLPEGPGPRSLFLQGHGNKVQYRNIWLIETK